MYSLIGDSSIVNRKYIANCKNCKFVSMQAVLITGVSTGIGYASAKYLKDKGFHVFGSVRSPEDAARLEKEIGPGFTALIFDIKNRNAVFAAAEKVKSIIRESYLRAIVNNSGIAISGPLQHISIDKFREQQEVNVIGTLNVIQAFLPLLGAVKNQIDKPGKIINISSVSGRIARPFYGPYAASKHAIEAMTGSLRRELIDFGIDVVAIEPGPTKSLAYQKAKEDEDTFEGTIYHELYQHKNKFIEFAQKVSIPAEHVARLIHETILSTKPKARNIIVAKKWYIQLLTLLPDRVVDKMITNQMKGIVKKGMK